MGDDIFLLSLVTRVYRTKIFHTEKKKSLDRSTPFSNPAAADDWAKNMRHIVTSSKNIFY